MKRKVTIFYSTVSGVNNKEISCDGISMVQLPNKGVISIEDTGDEIAINMRYPLSCYNIMKDVKTSMITIEEK